MQKFFFFMSNKNLRSKSHRHARLIEEENTPCMNHLKTGLEKTFLQKSEYISIHSADCIKQRGKHAALALLLELTLIF